MDYTPFFSICIPNFNHSRYIGETIESALAQDFPYFEVVVMDNCSTDNSWEIIQSYAAKDDRVRAYRNKYNVGFAPNLQRVTEKANGKFVILLSSDDLMEKSALSTYHGVIREHGNNVVLHSAFDIVDSDGDLASVVVRFYEGNSVGYSSYAKDELKEEWLDGSVISREGIFVIRNSILNAEGAAAFCSTCFPRSLWQQVEGYDVQYIQSPDTAFLFKILALNPSMIYVKKSLFQYRIHDFNQESQFLKIGALKQQMDKYQQSFSIEKHILDAAKLTREQVCERFINFYCLRDSLSALPKSWTRSLKLWAFGWAAYPAIMFKKPMTYVIWFLLLTGPIGQLLLRIVKALR